MLRSVLMTTICCALSGFAQLPTGEITGTVQDPSGSAITHATVTLTDVATNAERTVETNAQGIYSATALPPGQWSVRVTKTGFEAQVQKNIDLQVSQVARINFTLQVGNV